MRSILSPKDQRLIHIIEILNRTDWISLNDLAEKLDCSEKTVRNDLNTLTTQYDQIEIETSNLLGYRLVHNEHVNENISDDIINDTLIFQLTFVLLKQSKLRLIDLEDILFATPNSIRMAIAQFNDFFEPSSNITIENRPFQITGDEEKITTIFITRLIQSYFKKEQRYQAEFEMIEQLIDLLFKEHQGLKEAFYMDRFSLHLLLYVRIYREKNGHSMPHKNNYTSQSYAFLSNKHFKDDFFSVFGTSLNEQLVNKLVNFAKHEPFTTSFLQMTYFFPETSEYARLHPIVQILLSGVAKRLALPLLTAEELHEMMLPRPRSSKSKLEVVDYPIHDYLLQILQYELNEFVALVNPDAYQDLYELYLLVELALSVLPRWQALHQRLTTMDLTLVAGLDIIANREYQLVYREFFRFHCDRRIIFKELTMEQSGAQIDLLITNLAEADTTDIPLIHLSNLPTEEHIKKIEQFYFEHKLNRYLDYATLH